MCTHLRTASRAILPAGKRAGPTHDTRTVHARSRLISMRKLAIGASIFCLHAVSHLFVSPGVIRLVLVIFQFYSELLLSSHPAEKPFYFNLSILIENELIIQPNRFCELGEGD